MEHLESVVVNIPAGGGQQVLKAGKAGQQVRLRRFWGTIAAEGQIQFENSDQTALSGPLRLAARGGFVEPGDQNPEVCIVTAEGQGLVISSDQAFGGWAKVSQK